MSDKHPPAGYGDHYPDSSPVEPWHGQATHDGRPPVAVDRSPCETRRPIRELIDLMNTLPFSGLVQMEPPRYAGDMIEFMADTAAWFAGYRRVVQEQSDNYTRLAARVGRLEDERAMVRAFFGLSSTDDYS